MFGEEEVPNWARTLLLEMKDIKETFSQRFDGLDKSIAQIKKESKACVQRINNAEKRISDVEDASVTQGKVIKSLVKKVETLQNKATDLEARSKRNNIIITNVCEGRETGDGLLQLLAEIMRGVLNLEPMAPTPEIERAHRALRPLPDPGKPPRPIILRFLRWNDREKVMKEIAKAKRKITWEGKELCIFQDIPVEIQKQREKYNDLRSALRLQDIQHGILYPAKLIVTINQKTQVFKNYEEAEEKLKETNPDLFAI